MSNLQAIHHAVDTAADVHRDAYNAAFYELGLKWHWDEAVYENVLAESQERERILAYMTMHQTHLLKAYDPDFLIAAILTAKARCYDTLVQTGTRRTINWAEFHQAQIGT